MSCPAERRGRAKPFKGRGPVQGPIEELDADLRRRELGELTFRDFEVLQDVRERARIAGEQLLVRGDA
jgi:hypothetical protein